MRLNEAETDLIVKRADEPQIRHHFSKGGAHSLLHDDFEKISEGITSLAEVQGIAAIDLHNSRR